MVTRKLRRTLLISTVVAGLGASAVALPAAADRPELGSFGRNDCVRSRPGDRDLKVVALTGGNRLVCFESDQPETTNRIGRIWGMITDTQIVGIDYRPATGDLYGLGNAGGVYTLDVFTAQASLQSRLNVTLDGTAFGVDFNPTVDRLRIVSDTGQNLRANVDDGTTTVDTALNYLGPPPVSPALGVSSVAYTNNDADLNTATTLFDIDAALDQVVIQAPPNNGTLNATGKLGVDARAAVGFDIYSTVRDGSSIRNQAFASFNTSRGTAFYSIPALTGRASVIGWFRPTVVDIAIPLAQR